MNHEDALTAILADYRRELEKHHIDVLQTLVENYGIQCANNRKARIDGLVEHFRQQLLRGER